MEPPKYFPLGSVSNWNTMLGKVPFFLALDEYYRLYSKEHKYVGTFINGR